MKTITMEQLHVEIESLRDYEGAPSAHKVLLSLGFDEYAADDLEQEYWQWEEKQIWRNP